MDESGMRPSCPGREDGQDLSSITIQPCIVQGCGAVRITDEAVDLPFGICEKHLDQIRADTTTYGIVCLRCRRLAYLAQVPNRPKVRGDLQGQVLFTQRCSDCGGSVSPEQFFTWNPTTRWSADEDNGHESRT